MTQPGYDKFISSLKPDGTLITDKDLVVPDSKDEPKDISKYAISGTDIASKKFERKIVANMIILGYTNTILDIVSESALSRAIENNVPEGTEKLNLDAMKAGIELANKELKTIKSK
jgi:2-oxoglutarate ferredoxin oxidoreductase subunit gamma